MFFLLVAVVGNISGKIEPGPKARITSGVFGLVFILVGSVMHVRQSERDVAKPPNLTPRDPVNQEKDVQRTGTLYEGVVANISRFEKTGELVTVEVALQNTSDKDDAWVCSNASSSELIDEETAESWQPIRYGGAYGVGNCNYLHALQTGGAWAKFKVPDPEKRKFSFSWSLLNAPVDDLALAR